MTASLDVDDRRLLRQATAEALERHAPMSRIRSLIDAGRDLDPELETQLRELGLYDMEASDADGADAGFAEVAMIVQQLGTHCAISPYLATAAIATGGLAAAPPSASRASWHERMHQEGAVLTACPSGLEAVRQDGQLLLRGTATGVLHARHAAGLLVLAGEDREFVVAVEVPQPGVEIRRQPTYDATRAVDDVEFHDVVVDDSDVLAVGETAAAVAERMVARAAVSLAADSLGVADRALALTVDYTRTRNQFGRAIGSFQAVKHQLADRYIELAAAQSLLDAAARDVTSGVPNAGVMASAAKAVGCETATRTVGTAIQLHGAIGYTWEYDLHLLMKRAVLNEMLLGTLRWHRDRVGAQLPDRQHP